MQDEATGPSCHMPGNTDYLDQHMDGDHSDRQIDGDWQCASTKWVVTEALPLRQWQDQIRQVAFGWGCQWRSWSSSDWSQLEDNLSPPQHQLCPPGTLHLNIAEISRMPWASSDWRRHLHDNKKLPSLDWSLAKNISYGIDTVLLLAK